MMKALLLITTILTALALGACAAIQYPPFGSIPAGGRRVVVEASPNYRHGEFRNALPTPILSDGSSFIGALTRGSFEKRERPAPRAPVPTVKTDLRSLPRTQDTVVWLGHSSYYIQMGGQRILIDPVFSDHAAPFPWMVKAFEGTTIYGVKDMPEIDYLLITHDHYDHLDHATVRDLASKTRLAVTGLGTGAHLAQWGWAPGKIREADWFTSLQLEPGLTLHVLPARHYSGRLLSRNQSLWVGYALETPKRRVFFSGDTGFGPHFAEIARRFGGFDLAVLDAGQYNPRWAYIHMNPEEAARAAEILQAKALLAAHVGRFALARHAWDEPFQRMTAASRDKPYALLTPRIGEPVQLDDRHQRFPRWWEGIDGHPGDSRRDPMGAGEGRPDRSQ